MHEIPITSISANFSDSIMIFSRYNIFCDTLWPSRFVAMFYDVSAHCWYFASSADSFFDETAAAEQRQNIARLPQVLK